MGIHLFVNQPTPSTGTNLLLPTLKSRPLPVDLFLASALQKVDPELFGPLHGVPQFIDLRGREENFSTIQERFRKEGFFLTILSEEEGKEMDPEGIYGWIPLFEKIENFQQQHHHLWEKIVFTPDHFFGMENLHHYYLDRTFETDFEFRFIIPLFLKNHKKDKSLPLPHSFLFSLVSFFKKKYPDSYIHFQTENPTHLTPLQEIVSKMGSSITPFGIEWSGDFLKFENFSPPPKNLVWNLNQESLVKEINKIGVVKIQSLPTHLKISLSQNPQPITSFNPNFYPFKTIAWTPHKRRPHLTSEELVGLQTFYFNYFFRLDWVWKKLSDLKSFSNLIGLLEQSYRFLRFVFFSRAK